jgi:hypothetical protein
MNPPRRATPKLIAILGDSLSKHVPSRRSIVAASLAVAALTAALSGVPLANADELQDVSRLVASGKLDDAEKRADAFLKNSPKDAQMRFLKGVIVSQRGKRDEAAAIFTGLTQDYPELPEPYNNLAVIYAAQGQYDKARGALETAVRVAPNDATAYENLGDVYAALAARAYRDARRYDANNAPALRKLDSVRSLLTGSVASQSAGAVPSTPTATIPATTPDPRSQRNVGQARPAGPPATVQGFGAEPPEIVVPSLGSVVPQGSNVVAIGTPDAAGDAATSTLPGATTTVPPDPANPIPAISLAVQRWAANRSVKTGEVTIRVDGDIATARFREQAKAARRTVERNHFLTLKRNGTDWTVTDEKIES